jgi:hypothetical protein
VATFSAPVQLRELVQGLEVVRPQRDEAREQAPRSVVVTGPLRGLRSATGQARHVELQCGHVVVLEVLRAEHHLEVGERLAGVRDLDQLGPAQPRGNVGRVFLESLREEGLLPLRVAGEGRRPEVPARRQPGLARQRRTTAVEPRRFLGGATLELELRHRLERLARLLARRSGIERRVEPQNCALGVARFEQRLGGLEEERRRVVRPPGLQQCLRARGPEVGQLTRVAVLDVEGLEAAGELVVEPSQREGEGVVLSRCVLVSEQLARMAETGAHFGELLGGRVAREQRQHIFERPASVERTLEAQRQRGEIEQPRDVGEQPRRLLERDE